MILYVWLKYDKWSGPIPTCNMIVDKCITSDWGLAYPSLPAPYVAGESVNVFCNSGYVNKGSCE